MLRMGAVGAVGAVGEVGEVAPRWPRAVGSVAMDDASAPLKTPGFAPMVTAAATARLLMIVVGALCLACGPRAPAPTPERRPAPAASPSPTPATAEPATPSEDRSLAIGTQGAVASAETHASEIGVAILQRGGNAIDAAIAVGFALAVTHPSAGNLGGGGFMVIRTAEGEVAAIDYRERAPKSASSDMYLDAKGETTRASLDGALAAGIPGTVAGFALAHQRYGSLPWAELVAPAITLAAEGHPLDRFHVADLTQAVGRMMALGDSVSATYYRQADGSLYAEGDRWHQPELAATLRLIAGDPEAFYRPPFAERLAAGVRARGGIWTTEDLTDYRAVLREPIVFDYRGHQVIAMPPPSAGGVVLRHLLAASEILEIARHPWQSVDDIHLYVEAARRTYADRNALLGDPDFIEIPMESLLSRDYIRDRLADVDPVRATPSTAIGAGAPAPVESIETTHFSVIDGAGNAVANTYTLNTSFGAKVVVEGTGILLNNEMDDFAVKPGTANAYGLVQGERNRIEPGKRMLSSMTPTILVKDGALRAVVGTPGGSTITTTVAQILRALIDYNQPLDVAVKAPRFHHQWLPDRILSEPAADPAILEGLRARGHEVMVLGEGGLWQAIGHANCIEVEPGSGRLRAVADVARKGGAAAAY